MSAKVLGHCWELDLPANQMMVLLAMADHADHMGGNVYPSIGLVAWKTGYSERQVKRIVKELVAAKLLVVVQATPGEVIKYRIDLNAGVKKPAFERGQNVTGDYAQGGDKMSLPPEKGGQNVTTGGDIAMSPEPSFEPSVKESTKDSPLSPGKIVDFPAGDTDVAPEVYRGLGMPGLASKAEKQQTAKREQATRENLYTHPIWQAFRNEWPEDSRPIVANAARYVEVLEQLVANGVTPERVAALAKKRIAAGKTGYSFLFVPNDIHEIPASVAKPKGIWSQSAPDTSKKSDMTPEQRRAAVENAAAAKAAALREARDQKKAG